MPRDSIRIDHNRVTNELIESLARVRELPVDSCPISATVDLTLSGRNCVTYQYILLTALAAKAADPAIDVLTLQTDDPSQGAYAPRVLCKEVVYPFQQRYLNDVIDGANNDPYVNKPARWERLKKTNKATGDGKRVLFSLVDNLPRVGSSETARLCLDYMMTRLVRRSDAKARELEEVQQVVQDCSASSMREFLSDLLDQGFGGAALVLVVSALYRVQYPSEDGYEVLPHPVNQPGSSKRQLSDLDLTLDGEPFLGTELKDKPFTEDDVRRAAQAAAEGGLRSLLFVSGRHGSLPSQTRAYFAAVQDDFARQGVYVGLSDVDSMMDMVLSSHQDIDPAVVLQGIYDQVVRYAGTPETQMWVYSRLSQLR